MPTTSFKNYLMTAVITDDPAGDFMKDCRSDATFRRRRTLRTWYEVRRFVASHPRQRGFDDRMREAGHECWLRYCRERRQVEDAIAELVG